MVEREVLDDHAAPRGAHDVGTVEPRSVHHGERVPDEVAHRPEAGDAIRLAGAAVVEGERLVSRLYYVRDQAVERLARGHEAHDEQDGGAVAVRPPPQPHFTVVRVAAPRLGRQHRKLAVRGVGHVAATGTRALAEEFSGKSEPELTGRWLRLSPSLR